MKRVGIFMLVLLIALPLGFWVVLSFQARTLAAAVVSDARELDARVFTLKNEDAGSIIECLGRAADVTPDVSRQLPWTDATVMAVTSGAQSFDALSEAAVVELESHRAWLNQLTACGRQSTISATAGLGAFADVRNGRRQSMPGSMEALTSLAPLMMRSELAHGRADEAVELCAATLTVTTALLRLEGLEAMLSTMGPSRAVDAACVDALERASPETRSRFATRLRDVIDVAPDFAEIMRLERTSFALQLFGAWIPTSNDAQLPSNARRITADQRAAPWARGFAGTVALRMYWRKFDRGMREVEDAAKLPPPERDAEILRAQERLAAPFLRRFMASDPLDLRYQMYAGYLDSLHERLHALKAHAE